MKQTAYILILTIMLSSCATIFNQPYKNITIYTTEPSKIVYKQDTVETQDNKAHLEVKRQKETLSIVAITDSLTKSITVKPKNSSMYWANLCLLYGVGMLVDMENPKRYSYPERIYINSADTISKYYKYGKANNKGELDLHLSLPHFNFFNLTPQGEEMKVGASFWGLTVGLDYYHTKNQFVNLGGSYAFGVPFPIPAAVDFSGERELMSSWYISLSNNHKLWRFTTGYGLSFGKNIWDFGYYSWEEELPPTKAPITKSHYAFGLIFPAYFQLSEHFNIGVVYRPTFYRPNMTDKFAYEHLISIDFAWKIRLKK